MKYNTGDGLLIEIKLNPNKDERRVRKYLLSQLFTDEELNRIRPEKSLTKEQAKFNEDLKDIPPEDFQILPP